MGDGQFGKKKVVAIIPARGGSKRIPKKNIIDFFGKPLIAWTIQAALESKIFDRVIVSTDDEEIAKVSMNYGAEVPFLRKIYQDDYSPVSLATISTVKQTCDFYNEDYEIVVQLMPNCPLRESKHIIESFEYFRMHNHAFQISCFKFGWMNPWWAVKLDSDLKPNPLFEDAFKKRSQDIDDLYCPTGAIWIANKDRLLEEKTFYGDSHIFYPLNWKAAVDIDDMDDLQMAKAIYLMENKNIY